VSSSACGGLDTPYGRSAPYGWLACLALALLAGCGSRPTPPVGDTLIYARGEDANTLDPIHTDIGETVKVLVNVYDTLVTYDDATPELVPGLAESWTNSDDGLQWIFTLREGVEFHDGTLLNAQAVVFTFERLIMPEHPHVYESGRPYQASFNMIDRVEATDERTVVFTLKQPSAVFLQNLAMFPASIVCPAAVKQHGKKYGEHPIGTGPFMLESWKRDQQLALKAFDDHWRGPPGVRRLIFLPLREAATRLQQLRRNECHMADDLDHAELDKLAQQPSFRVQNQVGMNVAYLSLQMEKPPLNNRKVRLAIAEAIDKQAFVRLALANHAVPAKTLVPPAMWGHHEQLVDHAYDPEAAKALLAEGLAEERLSPPLRLTLNVMNQSRPYLQDPQVAASFIKDSLAKIGCEISVQPLDVNQHFTYVTAGKHQLALAGWSSDNNDPDNFLYPMLDPDNISDAGNNLSRYRSDELHQVLLAGQSELDREKRLAIYHQAQEIVLRDVPVVPLAHSEMRIAERDVVRDYVLHPTGIVRLRNVRLEATP
jgi:peptide/nickel transport system substrate-binding protein